MRKLLAVVIIFIMTMPAIAGQQRHGRQGYQHNTYQHQAQRHQHQQRHHQHHRHNNIAPWIAGGLALGALGAYAITPRAPRHIMTCWEEIIGYDRRGRPVYDEVCQ